MMDPQGGGQRGGFVVVSTIGNSVICTALGIGLDALFDHRRTLYVRGGHAQARVAPLLGHGARGAALSLSW